MKFKCIMWNIVKKKKKENQSSKTIVFYREQFNQTISRSDSDLTYQLPLKLWPGGQICPPASFYSAHESINNHCKSCPLVLYSTTPNTILHISECSSGILVLLSGLDDHWRTDQWKDFYWYNQSMENSLY